MHRWLLRFVGLFYLLVVLAAPVTLVFYRAFEHGIGPAWDAVTTPEAKHAFYLTVLIAAIAVPANTIFGVICALAIVRQRFPGKGIVNALVDLPLALSPVVVGLAFLLLYSRTGWFGSWLTDHGIQIVFALPSGRRTGVPEGARPIKKPPSRSTSSNWNSTCPPA